MKQHVLIPQFIESAPSELSEGVLYISERYRTALHNCCCGCRTKVVTPLNPAGWSYTLKSGTVTLRPSIGNWSFDCRSHYLITRGKVVWLEGMSERQIKYVKKKDTRDNETMIELENNNKLVANQLTVKRSDSHIRFLREWLVGVWKQLKSSGLR